MKCDQILPYIPGHVGGDLRSDTRALVATHIQECAACRAEAARASRVVTGLAQLSSTDVEPPVFLLDAILEHTVEEEGARRLVPMLPIAVGDIPRLLSEHRDVIASAAGTAVVAAGAAYALWRAVRSVRRPQPATT